jgi:hypothetical protein
MKADRLLGKAIKQYQRWEATQSPAALDSAIARFAELAAAVPAEGDPLRFQAEGMLALALKDRYTRGSVLADLDEAIAAVQRLLAHPNPPTDLSHDELDSFRIMLGWLTVERINSYSQPGAAEAVSNERLLGELRTAFDALGLAAATTSELVPPAERAEAARVRAQLGPKLMLVQSVVDREAAREPDLAGIERVLGEIADDHPNRGQLLLEAGFAHASLAMRFMLEPAPARRMEHFNRAERYLSHVVELLDPGYVEHGKAVFFLQFLPFMRWRSDPDRVSSAPPALARPSRAAGGTWPVRDDAPEAGRIPEQDLATLSSIITAMTAGADSPPADIARAVGELNQALTGVRDYSSPDIRARLPLAISVVFSSLLDHPAAKARDLADQDAARDQGRQLFEFLSQGGLLPQVAGDMPWLAPLAGIADPHIMQAQLAHGRLRAAAGDGDLAGVDYALGELARHLEALPAGHEFRWMVVLLLGDGWEARSTLSRLADDGIRGLRLLVAAYDEVAASPLLPVAANGSARFAARHAAAAAARLAWLTADAAGLTGALARIASLHDDPRLTAAERVGLASLHATTLRWRHELARDPADLDQAIARLEAAGEEAGDDADYELWRSLSLMSWTRGDRAARDHDRALSAGLRALARRAADVLQQGGTEHALRMARGHGPGHAIRLAGWSVAERRPDLAVAALERGRALVLHAATTATDLPGLLDQAGHDGLAREWRAQAGGDAEGASDLAAILGADPARLDPGHLAPDRLEPGSVDPDPLDPGQPGGESPLRIPSLLRRRVLAALAGTPAGAAVLAVPGPAGLAAALEQAGADAFAYLVAPPEGPGYALLVGADGDVVHLPLAGLSATGPLDAYDAAYQAATRAGWQDPDTRQRWQDSLGTLCDWAGAAIAPLLRELAGRTRATTLDGPDGPGRAVPRVVLIPVGRLGVVPWHAARTPGPAGRPRYAVEDAAFSYAASAGQFARAAGRRAWPVAAAPLLCASAGDPPLAEPEVTELRRRYYPHATVLGLAAGPASAAATPGEVLARLPGGAGAPASLVHFSCHADVGASLALSRLLLAGGQPLSVADILAQAQRHDPAAPGYLAVLSACMTDLAHVDHDEALTLASALLAAGAQAVIGARWPVQDLFTAPMMVMLHHFLAGGHPRPADALRAAQLWMLNSGRPALDGVPPALGSGLGSLLAEPYAWAAFTCQGGGSRPAAAPEPAALVG